ncbi:hypothetical protein PMIN06_011153 [Paraphaeosphaeria minitans]|uniref:Uncharacterized protein n=1 Tax=Paraphaeosphaeria minitans TaxID=565426 RepID=A0A9P6GPB3_9PLEO|nr:hypothetical protein PMIN01_04016 [Paraphaeosphaeria minitans]
MNTNVFLERESGNALPSRRRPKSKSLDATKSDDTNGAAPPNTSNEGSFSSMSNDFVRTARSEDGVERPGGTSFTGGSVLLAQHAEHNYPTPTQNSNKDTQERKHGVASNNVSYLGRLEYLRNDVPVNDDAGLPNEMPRKTSDTDLSILRIQRVEELPPRSTRDSLIEAFWARCYPWTPVVEREWEHKKSLEDRLFRWLKTLPDHLQLCHSTEGRPLKEYNPAAWQLHIQYFTVVVIFNRSPDGNPSTASVLASSFIAGIFADLIACDQLQYLGPIFTFYCLTTGIAQLS